MMNKKIYIAAFLLFTLLTSFSSPAQTVIQMEYSGGVYKIPCYVNGARMKFILDTGASSVCLSVDMAEYLLENDYLTSDDFYGVGSSSIADGSVVDHLKLIIKDIEIGGLHLSNVNAIVIAGQSAPLLMGQSALQKLGSYTINGNKLVINNYAQKGTGERSKLIETAKESMEKGYYAVAISSYVKAREIYELDYAHLEHLAWCYKYEGKYKECFEVCKKWLSLYENLNYKNFNSSIYELTWRCNYYFGFNEQALLYKQKRLLTRDPNQSKEQLAWDQEHLGQIYFGLKRYDDAIKCLEKAIIFEAEDKGKNPKNLVIKDSNLLGAIYWYLCDCYRHKYDNKNYKRYLELSTKCGYEKAIKINSSKDSRESFYLEVFKKY